MDHNIKLIIQKRFHEVNSLNFNEIALSVFNFQYSLNPVYKAYCNALGRTNNTITTIQEIPFLPVSFFKTHRIITNETVQPNLYFQSSGTTGQTPSTHYVSDEELYKASLLNGFTTFYGPPSQYIILGLLPSYLEREHASLVYMTNILMQESGQPENGYYLHNFQQLYEMLLVLKAKGKKVLLLGVTFALLDFAEAFPLNFPDLIIMETGGMKGRKEELTRQQVHQTLKKAFHVDAVHSEYGMTELLSQAYAKSNGLFSCTNTMKVLCRDINDPLELSLHGDGCINVIDLANLYSCSFIATDDLATIYPNNTFDVKGRIDNSALRGCSLMAL
jgi:hypothetical protein